MGKKMFGIVVLGLVFALVFPVVSAYATYDKELNAFGFIRIDTKNCEIKGFVFFGDNDGQALRFTIIKIKYDDGRIPLEIAGKVPFLMHHIEYNPA